MNFHNPNGPIKYFDRNVLQEHLILWKSEGEFFLEGETVYGRGRTVEEAFLDYLEEVKGLEKETESKEDV